MIFNVDGDLMTVYHQKIKDVDGTRYDSYFEISCDNYELDTVGDMRLSFSEYPNQSPKSFRMDNPVFADMIHSYLIEAKLNEMYL